MFFDEILKAVRNFSPPSALPFGAKRNVLIFTCMDPRLVGFLEKAMGIERGDAYFIKNAGILVTEDVIRSIAVALYSAAIEEIIVVGHTGCALANIKAYDFTESMRIRGISRDAIPSGDLRGWLGAQSNEKERVKESINAIRRSPLIPRDVPVNGILIDVDTGKFEVIEAGEVIKVSVSQETGSEKQFKDERMIESILDKRSVLDKPVDNEVKKQTAEEPFDWHLTMAPIQEPVEFMKQNVSSYDAGAKSIEKKKQNIIDSVKIKQQGQSKETSPPSTSVKQQDIFTPVKPEQKHAAIVPKLEEKVERFEIWLEDLGIFGGDVKRELKRLTGVMLDDARLFEQAIGTANTPEEAQKIKRHLQSMGAKAAIRKVVKKSSK